MDGGRLSVNMQTIKQTLEYLEERKNPLEELDE